MIKDQRCQSQEAVVKTTATPGGCNLLLVLAKVIHVILLNISDCCRGKTN